jgi:dTDP-4-amino-4,6-dideoxygalactose transaminase
LAHCQFILGPEVTELEQRLAAYAGAGHCVTVSSGTDALQIAMMAEGIGRGHAVFLPAFTYTATAEVPLVLGATPVFVDVDPTRSKSIRSTYAAVSPISRRRASCAHAPYRRGLVWPTLALGSPARYRRGGQFVPAR